MICNKCGCEIDNDAKFCTECGNIIAQESPTPQVCTKCGSPLKPDAAFCTSCGAPISTGNADTQNVPGENVYQASEQFIPEENEFQSNENLQFDKPASSNKKIIAVISIIVGIAIVATAGIFAYKKLANKEETTVSETETKKETKTKKNVEKEDEKPEINEIDPETIKNIIDNNTSYTDFGVYVLNLKNGYEYGYKENSKFLSSALGQIVIIDTVSKVLEDNDLSVDNEYVYFEYMPNGKEAPSSKNEDGTTISLKKCIEDVAVYGDNNKSNLLVDYIADVENKYSGFSVINDTLRKNGYKKTEINRKIFVDQSLIDTSASPNATTPKEISNIFKDLIKNSNIGSPSYMKNIFRCLDPEKNPMGMKKYIPEKYSSCNVNAITGQTTNDVAYISDSDTEIIIAILSTTPEGKVSVEGNKQREAVQQRILEYVLSTQFTEE